MKTPEPPDSAEHDALTEMERSQGWALYTARVHEMIERKRTSLEQHCDMELTASLRGYLEGIRMVLTIVDSLKEEIQCQRPLDMRR